MFGNGLPLGANATPLVPFYLGRRDSLTRESGHCIVSTNQVRALNRSGLGTAASNSASGFPLPAERSLLHTKSL